MKLTVCLWANKFAKLPDSVLEIEWADLVLELTRFREGIHDRDASAPLWSPVRYAPYEERGKLGVDWVFLFVGDIDCGTAPEVITPRLDALGLAYVIHSTGHHMLAKGDEPAVPRWRLVVPLAAPVAGADWEETYPRIAEHLLGPIWCPACKDPSRMFWLPVVVPGCDERICIQHEGAALDVGSAPALPVDVPVRYAGSVGSRASRRPGDEYNERGDHVALLEAHGWKLTGKSGPNETWTRPGKDTGTSATWHVEKRVFFPFTSSVPELPAGRALKLFGLKAAVEHGGDFRAAARAVVDLGYCSQPTIHTGPDLERVVAEAIAALGACGDIYQRGPMLVRVRDDGEHRPKRELIVRADDAPVIEPLPLAWALVGLSGAARWMKTAADGSEKVTMPPKDVVAAVATAGAWPGVPVLTAVVESPVVRSDGTILNTPGYDESTGILFRPTGAVDPVPDAPTPAEVATALMALAEVVCDVPFAHEAHCAAWLAAVLTPFARYTFDAPTPLFLIDASTRSSGKSLLAKVTGIITMGRKPATTTLSSNEEERKKKITSIVIAGDSMVLLDNIEGVIGGESLNSVLTATTWSDRWLGLSKMTGALPVNTTWLATSNNATLGKDTPRRTVPIRIEPECERPEQRGGFRHVHLEEWVTAERPRLAAAALTLIRAWHVAGRPAVPLPIMGSYEVWSDTVRQIVVWLGLPDPLLAQQLAIEAGGDTDHDELEALVEGLEELTQVRPLTAGEILAALNVPFGTQPPALKATLLERWPTAQGDLPSAKTLSRKLAQFKSRVVKGRSIRCEYHQGTLRWRVSKLSLNS